MEKIPSEKLRKCKRNHPVSTTMLVYHLGSLRQRLVVQIQPCSCCSAMTCHAKLLTIHNAMAMVRNIRVYKNSSIGVLSWTWCPSNKSMKVLLNKFGSKQSRNEGRTGSSPHCDTSCFSLGSIRICILTLGTTSSQWL